MQGLNISKLIPWKQLIFLVASLILLAWFIHNRDAGQVGLAVLSGSSVFPAVLLISFFYLFLQTLAWQLALGPSKGSFWSLFTLEAGGNALRSLSPFTLVGGDPVQGHLLQQKHEVTSGADSIVTDRAVHHLSTGIFVWLGLVVGFLNTPVLPFTIRIAIPVLATAAAVFCIVAIRTAPSGFYSAILRKLPSFGLAGSCQSPAVRGRVDESDRLLLSFYRNRSGTFYQALILHLICQGLLLGEVYLIGTALVPAFTISWALLLTALAPVVSGLFYIIPGSLAVMELAFAGLLAFAFGEPGAIAGIALVLIRRARALAWIIAGMVFAGNPFKMFLGK